MLFRELPKSYQVTGVNTTKVTKKDKNKTKELNYIKYYICKQKDYYANKYSKNQKIGSNLGNLVIND